MKNLLIILCCSAALHLSAQQGQKAPINFTHLENTMYEDFTDPVIVSDSAHVYAAPDSSSGVIQTLHLADRVWPVSYGKRESETSDTWTDTGTGVKHTTTIFHKEEWYRVDLGQGVGYIPAGNVATHSFYAGEDRRYFVKAGYQVAGKYAWGTMIYIYSNKGQRYTDSLFLENFTAGTAASLPDYWSHCNILISMNMINAYCGGGEQTVLIADVNGKLVKLLSSGQAFVEMTADREESQMWLPAKFGTGKILHLINGDIKKAFDENTGTLNTYTIPATIQIPKSELAIIERTVHKGFTDKNGEAIMSSPGVYKETVKKIFEYYRWTGQKLLRIQ